MQKPLRDLVFVVTLTMVALAVPLPKIGRIAESVADLAHPVLFAALTACLYAVLRRRLKLSKLSAAAWAAIVIAAFGLVSEIAQAFLGRNASWQDFLADLCGGGAALALVTDPHQASTVDRWSTAARRMAAVACLAMGFARPLTVFLDELLARGEMPVLASFEHPWQMSRWFFHACHASRVDEHATHGRYALRLDIEASKWPGPMFTLPLGCRDWRRARRLSFDLYVGEDQPLKLWVKILDQAQDGRASDRYEREFTLPAGATHFVISAEELREAPREREMDLSRIRRFQLYTLDLPQPRTLYLDNLRLEED